MGNSLYRAEIGLIQTWQPSTVSTDPALKDPSYHQPQETSDNVFSTPNMRKGVCVGKRSLIHSILCLLMLKKEISWNPSSLTEWDSIESLLHLKTSSDHKTEVVQCAFNVRFPTKPLSDVKRIVRSIKWRFCHRLLTLLSYETHMTFCFPWNKMGHFL